MNARAAGLTAAQSVILSASLSAHLVSISWAGGFRPQRQEYKLGGGGLVTVQAEPMGDLAACKERLVRFAAFHGSVVLQGPGILVAAYEPRSSKHDVRVLLSSPGVVWVTGERLDPGIPWQSVLAQVPRGVGAQIALDTKGLRRWVGTVPGGWLHSNYGKVRLPPLWFEEDEVMGVPPEAARGPEVGAFEMKGAAGLVWIYGLRQKASRSRGSLDKFVRSEIAHPVLRNGIWTGKRMRRPNLQCTIVSARGRCIVIHELFAGDSLFRARTGKLAVYLRRWLQCIPRSRHAMPSPRPRPMRRKLEANGVVFVRVIALRAATV